MPEAQSKAPEEQATPMGPSPVGTQAPPKGDGFCESSSES